MALHPLTGGCGAIKLLSIHQTMIAMIVQPMFAAAGYSLIYLLGGGGLFGALIIFIVLKMFRK
jgi:hypothetical protein